MAREIFPIGRAIAGLADEALAALRHADGAFGRLGHDGCVVDVPTGRDGASARIEKRPDEMTGAGALDHDFGNIEIPQTCRQLAPTNTATAPRLVRVVAKPGLVPFDRGFGGGWHLLNWRENRLIH